ncbi:nucleotidyltransferase family protein [Roseovarius sp. A21]|uniref:Nucleotidyltransferase family protein n=1 Tax=Roseovarius bejariae TaxID=2576383 RepID=A0A844CTJ7_9RHOB|nr:nucleotidyltransferase family protein [Roseovarius bejariae]MRU14010.1 nucleotidyltransferase family protein [Roseovarius bejariae]
MRGIGIVIPAAGTSSRMRGRDKLLEKAEGQPLLARQTRRALATGWPVLVTLRPGSARAEVLPGGIACREVPEAAEGLAASLRSGAAWAQSLDLKALMVLLADLPDLTSEDLETIAAAFTEDPSRIIRATDDSGKPGHPVIFPAKYFEAMQALHGDDGAKPLLRQHPPRLCPLPGLRATTDLDTPEAWAAWRARQAQE